MARSSGKPESAQQDPLTALVRAAVRAELADFEATPRPNSVEEPAVLTIDQLCGKLQISRSKYDSLANAGMPHIKVGSVRRYDLAEVLTWLRARSEAA